MTSREMQLKQNEAFTQKAPIHFAMSLLFNLLTGKHLHFTPHLARATLTNLVLSTQANRESAILSVTRGWHGR